MSKRVLILVEGQTEERFVKDVLAPPFLERQLFFHPTILVMKRVKDGPNFKGGVTSFAKFERDARRLLHSSGGALVTMMLDYYQLPADFPGMKSRPPNSSPRERVRHVESAIGAHFGSLANFIPFLVLHEFEALLFSSPTELAHVLTNVGKLDALEGIRSVVKSPEEINDRPESAPSKRVLDLFPAYKKTVHGPTTAARIGLETIRAECPHFNEWITRLESLAAA